MDIQSEIKREDKMVSEWLLFYSERLADHNKRRNDILFSSPAPSDGMPKGTSTGDPTANKGASMVELEESEKWLYIVEKVRDKIHPKLQIFLRLRQECRYSRGRNGWVAYVQWHYAEEVAKMLNKDPRETWIESRNTFTRWWDTLVKITAREAAKNGLIK